MKKQNGNISMREIRTIARRIAENFDVEKIILFGSFAYGYPTKVSDVDLLVVMKTKKTHSEIRYQIYSLLADVTAPLDVVIRNPEQLRSAPSGRDWFLQDIVNKGRVVYG